MCGEGIVGDGLIYLEVLAALGAGVFVGGHISSQTLRAPGLHPGPERLAEVLAATQRRPRVSFPPT